jgi:hypothetical protein
LKLRFSVLLLLAAFAVGCHHEPSPTGIDLLPGSDIIGLATFDSQQALSAVRTSSYSKPTVAATAPYLSLGKTADYESRILIRWLNFPSDVVAGGSITSATITLHRAPYGFGDAAAPFSFEAREVKSWWSSYTFTSDSLATMQAQLGGVAGTYSGSAKDSVTFTVDTALVRSWLLLMGTQSFADIRGLLLQPTAGTGSVLAFESYEKAGKIPTLSLRMTLNGKDTTFAISALEDTFIATGPKVPATSLAVHGGLSTRGRLSIDVSGVPAGSIVNQAVLTLTPDKNATVKRYRGADSLLIHELKDTALMTLGDVSMYTQVADSSKHWVLKSYAFTQLVQNWVNHPEMNRGLVLQLISESSDLDLLAFHGADADPALRPKLTILYTKKP